MRGEARRREGKVLSGLQSRWLEAELGGMVRIANLEFDDAKQLLVTKLSDRLVVTAVASFYAKYIPGTKPPRAKEDRVQVLLDFVVTQ